MSLFGYKKQFLIYWLPVFVWCLVIYYLSSIPSLKSDFASYIDLILRKIAHITEFAILTFLSFRACSLSFDKKKSIFFAVVFSFIFALTDEYHQSFIYGRNGNFFDVVIDSIGIMIVFLYLKYYVSRKNIKQ